MKINRTIKYGIAGLLAAFFMFHIVCTLLFTLPERFVSKSLKFFSFSYMYPIFNQGWALFAPAPYINKELWLSYQNKNGKWSIWMEPFSKNLKQCQQFRVTGDSKIILAESSILHYLEKENWQQFGITKELNGDTNSVYFFALKYAVSQHLKKEKIDFTKVQIRLLLSEFNTPEIKKTVYYSF